MKKINLKGLSDVLSEKEMKNVMGGSGCVTDRCPPGTECCYPAWNWCVNGLCQSRPRP